MLCLGHCKSAGEIIRYTYLTYRQFKEGHSKYDAANSLELPEDEPTAMFNLFTIMHWNTDKVNKLEDGWLQRLAVVCDKYQCAE